MFRPIVTVLLCSLFATSVAPLVGCAGQEVPVGKSEQELKKRSDGGPTGNGQTCSWDGTVSYDVATGQTTASPPSPGPYQVGDDFPSLDGCNDCTCSAQGIMCTLRSCGPNSSPPSSPKACSMDAMLCPDGSSVGRTGPNCEFAPCPNEVACTDDARICPDGSSVARVGPKCEFAPCPN